MQTNQHTIGTRNRKIVPLPSILEMEPKKARRAWARFMADNDFVGNEFVRAEYVRLSIEELILNQGREAEPTSRNNLASQIAIFCGENF